jgi:hypothetical protein|tara:strand:- start:299 stop:610 length:312 start_codon:yes stop_codon:yes gene_type:complete
MGLRNVYRVWACSGYNYESGELDSITPEVITEFIFGDFSSGIIANQTIEKFIIDFRRNKPGQQIPKFKIVEHIINGNNVDVFFQNSDSKLQGMEDPNINQNIP